MREEVGGRVVREEVRGSSVMRVVTRDGEVREVRDGVSRPVVRGRRHAQVYKVQVQVQV